MYRFNESLYITSRLMEQIAYDYDLVFCEDINAYAERDESYYIEDDGCWVSDNSDYYYCEHCGCWVSEWNWNDSLGCCCSCEDELCLVKNYHANKGNYTYFGSVPFRIGAEVEVDSDSWLADREDTARKVYDILGEHAYYEEDGSLSENGFEIITQPHTIDEFFRLEWARVFDILLADDYRAHDAGNCGLHLHFSREWFGETEAERVQNIARLVMFYDRNFDTLLKLSRRVETGYCERDYISRQYDDIETERDAENLVDDKKCGSRYTAVNLTCYDRHGTVEFRLGRGTLNYKTFRAWIDLHRAIVEQSRKPHTYDFNEWVNENTVEPSTLEYINRRLGHATIESDTESTIERDLVEDMSFDEFTALIDELIA